MFTCGCAVLGRVRVPLEVRNNPKDTENNVDNGIRPAAVGEIGIFVSRWVRPPCSEGGRRGPPVALFSQSKLHPQGVCLKDLGGHRATFTVSRDGWFPGGLNPFRCASRRWDFRCCSVCPQPTTPPNISSHRREACETRRFVSRGRLGTILLRLRRRLEVCRLPSAPDRHPTLVAVFIHRRRQPASAVSTIN